MNSRTAYLTLAVLFAINTLNFFDRQILPAVQERIKKDWKLSDAELGWLGTAFILLYAFVGLPLGRLADVWRRKWLLSAGVGLWSLLTVGSGLAWNFASLFVMRLGVGVGEATCAPVASSWIGDLFPAAKRARAMALFMLGLPLGLALSFVVSSVIAKEWGWEAAFFVAGAPGLALALVALLLHEPERDRPLLRRGAGEGTFWSSVRQVLLLPTMWWLIVSGALHNFNMYALATFISSFFQRYHALPIDQAGWMSGLIYGVGAAGIFLGGWLGDWAHRWGTRGRLHVAWIAVAVAIPCFLLALAVEPGHAWQAAAWLFPAHLLVYFYYGTVYATIQDIMPPALRGIAMAVYFCGMYVLGAVWGPAGTGWISDYCASRAAALAGASAVSDSHKAVGLHDALYVVPIICVPLVFVLLAASATVTRDQRKVGKREV
jgi:MFS family permease